MRGLTKQLAIFLLADDRPLNRCSSLHTVRVRDLCLRPPGTPLEVRAEVAAGLGVAILSPWLVLNFMRLPATRVHLVLSLHRLRKPGQDLSIHRTGFSLRIASSIIIAEI